MAAWRREPPNKQERQIRLQLSDFDDLLVTVAHFRRQMHLITQDQSSLDTGRTFAHLDEMPEMTQKFVASILVADRPGIMLAITSAITDLDGNINGVRQTVVEGYFSIVLTATFPQAMPAATIDDAIKANFDPDEASIVVRPYAPVATAPRLINAQRYILVIAGEDKPGVLKAATTCLLEFGINIEDWSYYFEERDVTYIGDLSMPADISVTDAQRKLRDVLTPLDMHCSLQHENIFRATSELGSIKRILEGRHAS